jgi:hypothetical protein
MSTHSEGSLVELSAHRLLNIQDGKGLTVSCRAGSLWITQDSDRRDIVLGPGERFTLDRNGLALVHAVTDALVVVSRSRRTPLRAQLERRAAA